MGSSTVPGTSPEKEQNWSLELLSHFEVLLLLCFEAPENQIFQVDSVSEFTCVLLSIVNQISVLRNVKA